MSDRLDLTKSLFDFVRQSHALKKKSELKTQFGEVLGGLGYDYFTVTELTGLNGIITPSNTFGHNNDPWERYYFSKQYFRHDDCFKGILKESKLFTWSDARKFSPENSIGKKIMHEAADFGMSEGILVPIRSFDGNLSFVTVSGKHVDVSEDAKSVVEVAGLFFSERYRSFKERDDKLANTNPLTPRQTEVLTWLATGKRYDDIADILGISTKTVTRHVEDAKRRLNVVTHAQLTVEAYRNGHIKL